MSNMTKYNRSRPHADSMKIEKLILTIAAASMLVLIPLGVTLKQKGVQLKADVNHRRELEFKIDRVQQELNDAATRVESSSESIERLNAEKQQLEAEKAELNKKLEAKAKEKSIVARAQAAAQPRVSTPAVAVKGDCEAYRGEIAKYFPAAQVNNAIRVMNAESGCRSWADNPTDGHPNCLGSRGLFQIGCDSTPFYNHMFDATANIQQAGAMFAKRGWQPWSVSRIPGVIQ